MDRLHKKYESLILAKDSISLVNRLAQNYLKKELYDNNHHRLDSISYNISIVITYAKPFSLNKGVYRFPQKILKVLTTSQKQFHNKICKYRNEIFAHSDGEIFKAQLSEFNSGYFPGVRVPLVTYLGLQKDEIKELIQMTDKLTNKILEEMDILKPKIIDKYKPLHKDFI